MRPELDQSLSLDIPTPRPPRLPPVDNAIKPHQRARSQRHQHCASSEKSHTARRAKHIEDGIRVELVVSVALLDPEPVAECNAPGKSEGRQHGNSVGRREEEEI